jgi:EmrB/QacA subfamily drug resistance transporter
MLDNHILGSQKPLDEKEMATARRQRYFVFGIVAMALLMASIDSTIVAVSLPTMLVDMNTNLAWLGWTITGYQFSQSIIMPIAGKFSDEWGRKKIFLGAVILFTVSSMAAGLAPNIYLLIVFRIIQGIGGGIFLPSATGIISDTFGSKRATAIGLFGSIFPIGGILGPNIGGFIIDHFSWRWIFFVNVPIGIVLLIFGAMVLPKTALASYKQRVDMVGAGLFSGAMLALLYAMTHWGNNPDNPGAITWIFFAVSGVLLYLFIRREDSTEQPMIELKLLRWRPFLAANIYNFVFGAVVFGFFSFIPYYATVAYGMTAGESGLVLTPRSLTMMVVSALTSFYIIKFRYRLPMIIGLLLISASMFLLSQGYRDVSILGMSFHNLALLAVLVMLGGAGMGIANPAANNAALDLLPEKVAAVAGMRGMFRSVGGVLGTAGLVLALSHYADKAVGMQHILLYMSIVLLFLIPVVFMIPDSAHERRNRSKNGLVN